jgi:hypothetical protein
MQGQHKVRIIIEPHAPKTKLLVILENNKVRQYLLECFDF